MKILLLILISGVSTTTYCNLCSDFNIETHFGVFFANPRDLQEGYRDDVQRCNSTAVPRQECDAACFSLNVTSLAIKSRQLLPFGVSYGCSSQLLPEPLRESPQCVRRDIVLRTVPPYVVQAEYCTCFGSSCNKVSVLPSLKRESHHFYASRSSGNSLLCLSILFMFLPVLLEMH